MHRYFLYIFTAFLTFGIGLILMSALYFCLIPEKQIISKKKPKLPLNSQEGLNKEKVNSVKENQQESFPVCTDEVILLLWRELAKDEYYKKWKKNFEDESKCLKKMFKVEPFDLNGDGKNEYLIRGDHHVFCGATANCYFWIYRKAGKKYRRILKEHSFLDGRDIFSQIKKSRTKKFKDILLEVRVSRNAHADRLYKFDGKKYRERKCIIRQWNELKPEEKTKIISCRKFEKNRGYKLF